MTRYVFVYVYPLYQDFLNLCNFEEEGATDIVGVNMF